MQKTDVFDEVAQSAVIFKGDSSVNFDDPYLKTFRNVGIEACVIPPLRFQFINLNELINSLRIPAEYSSVVFTSPRTVEAMFLAFEAIPSMEEKNELCQLWKENKLFFAVGKSTAEAANAKLGFQCLGEESGSGDALLPYITANLTPSEKKVLFPCGNLAKDNIQTSLSNQGFQVQSIIVYETTANPMLEHNVKQIIESKDRLPQIMVFFSPSGVKSVFPILKSIGVNFDEIKFVSIGPTTTEALKTHGMCVYAQAAKPNPESLIEAISKGVIS